MKDRRGGTRVRALGDGDLSYGRFDASPHATLVLRGGRIHYANEALGRLLSMPSARLAGVGLKDLVVPEEQGRVVERYRRRMQGELVPDSYETTLRAATGARRAVRVSTTREGDDVLVAVEDLSNDVARRERLTALACLGTAIQAEGSASAVFEHVLAGVFELGLSCVLLREEGERAVVEAVRVLPMQLAALEAAAGRPVVGLTGRWQPAELARLEVGAAFVDDVLAAVDGFFPASVARPLNELQAHGLMRGGLVRVQGSGGPDHVLVLVGDWLRDDDVPALGMFGAQVSAALTAARIIGDLSRRNSELATLNHIATLARTASDLQSLLAQAVDEIVRFFDADGAAVFLIDRRDPCLVFEYAQGNADSSREVFPRIPTNAVGSQMWTIVRDARPRLFDISEFSGNVRLQLEGMGSRRVASAPLMARSAVLGVLNLHFRAPRELTDRDLELLQVMGSHFGGAAESHRLMGELRERIDELTLVHGDLERSYAELGRAQSQLVERERLAAVGELAAVVAHEVRNPLNVIFNSLGSLRRLVKPERNAEMLLDIVGEEADRLNRIVGDLLDYVRPLAVEPAPTALRRILDDALGSALAGAGGGVSLDCQVDDALPEVPMDTRLVRQALLNLALNAVQAMPQGGTLTVRARLDGPPSAPVARIDLSDTGTGIPDDVRPRIFEPFFTTKPTGTGLGLAVVKRIVEGHRGEVLVSSGEGHGTTFTIRLPLADGQVLS